MLKWQACLQIPAVSMPIIKLFITDSSLSFSVGRFLLLFKQQLSLPWLMFLLNHSMASIHIGHVFYPFSDLHIKFTAIALIVFLTWINMKGIKTGATFSTIILLLVFTGVLLIIVFGLGSKASDITATMQSNTTNGAGISASGIFTAMLAAFWAYQGWAGIGYVGGEVKNPHRNIPKGIAIGVFIVIALYLLINLTYLSLLST